VGERRFPGDFLRFQGITLGIQKYLLTWAFNGANVSLKPATTAQAEYGKPSGKRWQHRYPGRLVPDKTCGRPLD
jgi:hypothetical protein